MKVVIVGAGIGGLTAAIALRQAGIETEIYERAPELREVGAGISLWANALRALDRLGLGEAIRARSVSYHRSALLRADGRTILNTPLDEMVRRLGTAVIVLHRADLLATLGARAGEVRLGHECVGFDDHADSVTARFANGAEARGDVVAGADGLHSAIRAQLHPGEPVRYSGYSAWRCVSRFDGAGMTVSETWGPGRRFGIVPMADGFVYWFATKNAPLGQTDPAGRTKQVLLELFGGWHEPIPALISAADESTILRNDIFDRDPLTAWGEGRVTLLGDAAHPMTPNLGQGGCQAVEDAVVLARLLAGHTSVFAALRAYEARRRARTRPIVLRSRQVGAIGQLQNRLATSIRDSLFRSMPARIALRQLESLIAYDGHLV